jgi:hypothetical protein
LNKVSLMILLDKNGRSQVSTEIQHKETCIQMMNIMYIYEQISHHDLNFRFKLSSVCEWPKFWFKDIKCMWPYDIKTKKQVDYVSIHSVILQFMKKLIHVCFLSMLLHSFMYWFMISFVWYVGYIC